MTTPVTVDVAQLVRQAVGVVLDIDPSSVPDDALLVDDLGADSLALVEVVEVLEGSLRERGLVVHVDDDQIEQMTTVRVAVAVVDRLRGSA